MRTNEPTETATLMRIGQLRRMTVMELRERYRDVFGEETRSHHKEFLFRRIAWRIQANAEGGLSERARQRALEIAEDADLRVTPPRSNNCNEAAGRVVAAKIAQTPDRRLPLAGTTLTRQYQDTMVVVRVLDRGFEYEGRRYRSLSAIASQVAGTRWNGYTFFGLGRKERGRAQGK